MVNESVAVLMSRSLTSDALSLAAMSPTEVTEKLGLLRMKDRSWYCHPSNALDGDGLFEGGCRIAEVAAGG